MTREENEYEMVDIVAMMTVAAVVEIIESTVAEVEGIVVVGAEVEETELAETVGIEMDVDTVVIAKIAEIVIANDHLVMKVKIAVTSELSLITMKSKL